MAFYSINQLSPLRTFHDKDHVLVSTTGTSRVECYLCRSRFDGRVRVRTGCPACNHGFCVKCFAVFHYHPFLKDLCTELKNKSGTKPKPIGSLQSTYDNMYNCEDPMHGDISVFPGISKAIECEKDSIVGKSEKTKDHQEEEHDTMHSDGDGAQLGEEEVYTSGEDEHTCDQELYSDGTICMALV